MEDTVRANSQPGAVARQHREHNSVLSTVKAIVSPLLPVFSLIAKGWNGMGRPARVTLVIVTALALWETVRFFDIPVFLVPPPTMVLEIMWQEPRWMLLHSWHTLFETFIGFGLAVSFGILLAVLIVSSKFLEETLYVLLVTMNSVPKVAIAPLFVVWMGTGLSPKVAISATIALFVIVIDMVLGLRSVDPEMLDLAKSFKGSAWQILVKIRFPNSLPNLFAGMKVGITLALIGAIVGEFVASDRGLGYVILVAQGQFDTPQMFAAIIMLSVMGTLLFFIVDLCERLAVPWHVSRRREDGGGEPPPTHAF